MSFLRRIFSKRKCSAGAIGIIGGADGPTSIFISDRNKANSSAEHAFFQDAKAKIISDYRPIHEMEAHLINHYDAVPYQLSEKRLELLKANIIMNKFKEVLVLPIPLESKPTRRQLRKYLQYDTFFEQAKSYPAEKLGLIMKAYKLPYLGEDENEAVAELEMTSGYFSISGVQKEIADALIMWQGVSEEDIANETPRFIVYAHTLKDIGKL